MMNYSEFFYGTGCSNGSQENDNCCNTQNNCRPPADPCCGPAPDNCCPPPPVPPAPIIKYFINKMPPKMFLFAEVNSIPDKV